MLELLFILLVVLLYLSYELLNNEVFSPSFLFIAGFTCCTFMACLYKDVWDLNLHFNTFVLILTGAITFLLVETIYRKRHKIRIIHTGKNLSIHSVLSSYKLLFLLIFQILVYYYVARYKMAFSGFSIIGEALADIDHQTKFEDEKFMLPWFLNVPNAFSQTTGYVWCCLFPFYMMKCRGNIFTKILIGLNLLASLVGSLLSGGRMPVLCYIIPLLIVWMILLVNGRSKKHKTLSNKVKLYILGIIIAFGSSFSILGEIIGRNTDTFDENYLFAVYCGAQIKNLDDYVNVSKNKQESKLFLEQSLSSLYKFCDTRLGTNFRPKHNENTFNNNGNYFLGNVYSAYKEYYDDLGMASFIFIGIMALCLVWLFTKMRNSDFWITGNLDLWVLMYCFLSATSFLSFFSEQFFIRFLSVEYMIRTIIYYYIMIWFLYGKTKKI